MSHSKISIVHVSAICALSLSTLGPFEKRIAHAGDAATCHFHGKKPAAESMVKSCALKRVTMLINAKKIPKEWSSTTKEQVSLEVVDGKKGKEWKATLTNPQIMVNGEPKPLYMFFTHQGNFIAANFTGK